VRRRDGRGGAGWERLLGRVIGLMSEMWPAGLGLPGHWGMWERDIDWDGIYPDWILVHLPGPFCASAG